MSAFGSRCMGPMTELRRNIAIEGADARAREPSSDATRGVVRLEVGRQPGSGATADFGSVPPGPRRSTTVIRRILASITRRSWTPLPGNATT